MDPEHVAERDREEEQERGQQRSVGTNTLEQQALEQEGGEDEQQQVRHDRPPLRRETYEGREVDRVEGGLRVHQGGAAVGALEDQGVRDLARGVQIAPVVRGLVPAIEVERQALGLHRVDALVAHRVRPVPRVEDGHGSRQDQDQRP